jgi:hypothetical protein
MGNEERSLLTVEHAFRAMYEFIHAHYAVAPAGGIPALLADIETRHDGSPGDPGAWSEWLEAIDRAAPLIEPTEP